MISKIKEIVGTGDVNGFTTCLKGELKRYIVAFTHNDKLDYNILLEQVLDNQDLYQNINLGGWTDSKTGIKYIDISTSFYNEKQAIEFAKMFKQIAIFDIVESKEIIVK